jgi:uncharacterized protein (DUF2336 family)
MTARASAELIVDLSEAVSGRSLDRRVLMLRRATNLFLSYGRRLNDQQIGTFDDVLLKLVDCVDVQSLVQLSSSLADLDPAPSQTVRCLARHADVSVAYPVLHRSHSFGTEELRELASHLGRKHLVAVAGRQTLDEAVTDILLKRGGNEICRVLAKNAGARFSKDGFKLMVASAKSNPDIAESLGLRSDIAPAMLCQLLLTMSDKQRLALLKAAPPHSRQSIREALDGIASNVSEKAPEPLVYSEAHARVLELSKTGKLSDSAVNGFAVRREYTSVIAALVLLSGAPLESIEPLMEQESCERLVVACRASRLNWQTTLAIVRSRNVPQISDEEIAQAKEQFEKLFLSAAQWAIRHGAPSGPITA